jgi:LEA14-like dessication related protein
MYGVNRMRAVKGFGLLTTVWLLSSCALMSPSYEKPEVSLVNVTPLEREGLEQRIAVGLNIINPGSSDLKISGMSYRLKLQDIKVITGVTSGLKPIPSYSESRVNLQASVNLFSGFRVLESLLNSKGGPVRYELETKISTGWWKLPITVVESGSIDLGAIQ